MDAVVRLLKLHSHGAHYAMDICCMGLECIGGGLNSHVGIEIDVVSERSKFVIHGFGEFFQSFVEEFLRY